MTEPSGPPADDQTLPAETDALVETDQPTTQSGADSTVGTGSVLGIGCMIVVLLIVCIGIAVYLVR